MARDIHSEIQGARAWYDSVAEAFVKRYQGMSGEYFRLFEEDVFASLVPTGAMVLDLGCGNGRLAQRLQDDESELVVAVDLSLEMLRLGSPAVRRVQADASRLCFQDQAFDFVASLGMFEYLADPTPFLREVHRVLRPGGKLAFTFHQVSGRARSPQEDEEGLYYGRKVKERNRLWQRQVRTLAQVRMDLQKNGFLPLTGRRIFLRLPAAVFRWGVRLRSGWPGAGGVLVRAAQWLERWAGRRFLAGSTGNTIMIAEKR